MESAAKRPRTLPDWNAYEPCPVEVETVIVDSILDFKALVKRGEADTTEFENPSDQLVRQAVEKLENYGYDGYSDTRLRQEIKYLAAYNECHATATALAQSQSDSIIPKEDALKLKRDFGIKLVKRVSRGMDLPRLALALKPMEAPEMRYSPAESSSHHKTGLSDIEDNSDDDLIIDMSQRDAAPAKPSSPVTAPVKTVKPVTPASPPPAPAPAPAIKPKEIKIQSKPAPPVSLQPKSVSLTPKIAKLPTIKPMSTSTPRKVGGGPTDGLRVMSRPTDGDRSDLAMTFAITRAIANSDVSQLTKNRAFVYIGTHRDIRPILAELLKLNDGQFESLIEHIGTEA